MFFLYPDIKLKHKIINKYKINVILDVGGHNGGYGLEMNLYGYKNKIISFEPAREPFQELQKRAKKNPLWKCYNYALGNEEKEKSIKILKNTTASSFLEPTELFSEIAGRFANVIKEEIVIVKRLDQLIPVFCTPSDSILLKIDTQGFEKQVLEGADRHLKDIQLIQLEVSFNQLYRNEPLIDEMLVYMSQKGFIPICIEPHPFDKTTFHQIQADILFVNTNRMIYKI